MENDFNIPIVRKSKTCRSHPITHRKKFLPSEVAAPNMLDLQGITPVSEKKS